MCWGEFTYSRTRVYWTAVRDFGGKVRRSVWEEDGWTVEMEGKAGVTGGTRGRQGTLGQGEFQNRGQEGVDLPRRVEWGLVGFLSRVVSRH